MMHSPPISPCASPGRVPQVISISAMTSGTRSESVDSLMIGESPSAHIAMGLLRPPTAGQPIPRSKKKYFSALASSAPNCTSLPEYPNVNKSSKAPAALPYMRSSSMSLSTCGIRREVGVCSLTRSLSNMSTASAPNIPGCSIIFGDQNNVTAFITDAAKSQVGFPSMMRWKPSTNLSRRRPSATPSSTSTGSAVSKDGASAAVNVEEAEARGAVDNDALFVEDGVDAMTCDTEDATPVPSTSTTRHRSISDASTIQPQTRNSKRYNILEEIGDGAFSRVYKGKDTLTQRDVAVKAISAHPNFYGECSNGMESVDIDREWKITCSLRHKNVVTLLDHFERDEEYGNFQYLIFEYADGGDLFDLLDSGHIDNDESMCKLFAIQMADALVYVHSQGIVHNDVKLENMLISSNNTVKLCDFGLAGPVGEVRHGRPHGTCAYMAPELVCVREHENYQLSFQGDVWSFGIVLFAMIFADLPWDQAMRTDDAYTVFVCANEHEVEYMQPWALLAPELREMVLNALSHISRRPTMEEVREVVLTPWLITHSEEQCESDTDNDAVVSIGTLLGEEVEGVHLDDKDTWTLISNLRESTSQHTPHHHLQQNHCQNPPTDMPPSALILSSGEQTPTSSRSSPLASPSGTPWLETITTAHTISGDDGQKQQYHLSLKRKSCRRSSWLDGVMSLTPIDSPMQTPTQSPLVLRKTSGD